MMLAENKVILNIELGFRNTFDLGDILDMTVWLFGFLNFGYFGPQVLSPLSTFFSAPDSPSLAKSFLIMSGNRTKTLTAWWNLRGWSFFS